MPTYTTLLTYTTLDFIQVKEYFDILFLDETTIQLYKKVQID